MARGTSRNNKRKKRPESYSEQYQVLTRDSYDRIAEELENALESAQPGETVIKLLKALRDAKKIRDEALGGAPESVDQKGPGGRFDVSGLGASPRS